MPFCLEIQLFPELMAVGRGALNTLGPAARTGAGPASRHAQVPRVCPSPPMVTRGTGGSNRNLTGIPTRDVIYPTQPEAKPSQAELTKASL